MSNGTGYRVVNNNLFFEFAGGVISRRIMVIVACLLLIFFLPVSVNQNGVTAEAAEQSLSPSQSVPNEITTYATELARVDQHLSARKSFADTRPDSWLHLSRVASVQLERAQLSGEFNDFAAAQSTLQKAFAMVDRGVGPVLLRARLNYSLHRLSAIEDDLVAAESALLVSKPDLELISGIRADVMFQTGQYPEARQRYDELEDTYPSTTSAIRLAHYHSHIGQYEAAEQWFAKAQDRVAGQSERLRAWLKLQLGILDLERGRLNEALVHYEDALDLFPGYWLVEEHIAEIHALQGQTDKAESSYRDLIKRTGSPLFMIALAEILEQRDLSEKAEANELFQEAGGIFETIASQIPEAIAGHALEYYLHSGDPEQTLKMAQSNYQLRPGGQPVLMLAQAHAINNQLEQAQSILDTLLTTPYRSAELHATAAIVYRAVGLDNLAAEQERLATVINPTALDDVDWLLGKLNG